MKENNGMGYLLAAFVTLILGIILLGVYADTSVARTQLKGDAQTISIASARLDGGTINESVYFYPTHLIESASGWRRDTTGCGSDSSAIYGTVRITNASGTVFADGVDYILNTEGSYTLVNTKNVNASVSNVTYFTMSYCPDGYLGSGWSRSMQNLSVGLFALMCLAAAIAFLYLGGKEMLGK